MPGRSPLERWCDKVQITESCWLWTGSLDTSGYGLLRVARRLKKAHRFSFETFVGPIPDGLQMDHLCRVRHCVNPDHLEPVTSGENARRSPIHHASQTHCIHGHEFTPENTYRFPTRGGWGRGCKACWAVRRAARRAS